jgi:hypothetical protein
MMMKMNKMMPMPKNMEALNKLQIYLTKMEWAQKYLQQMSQQSAR